MSASLAVLALMLLSTTQIVERAPPANRPLLTPPRDTVRWGNELPPIRDLMEMPPDELREALDRATRLPVTASHRTAAQALVLRALAFKDPRVASALAPFPTRVEVTPEANVPPETAERLEIEMVRVLNDLGLPAVADDGTHAGTLRITLDVVENDVRRSVLAGTGVRSFSIRVAGALYRPDGTLLLEYGSVRSALGVNLKLAAERDFDRNAAAHHRELIDQLARFALSVP